MFIDGNRLSATALNKLSDDIANLHGHTQFIQPAFKPQVYGAGQMSGAKWWIRHYHRYLHYKLTIDSGSISPADLRLYYNGTMVRQVTSGLTGPVTINSPVIDLNSLGLTVGQWYELYWQGEMSNAGVAWYLKESPSATLPASSGYITPNQWSDGQKLLAADLNELLTDVAYLNGLVPKVHIPFNTGVYPGGTMGGTVWVMPHRHRYLHYWLQITAGNIDPNLRLLYNNVELLSISSPSALTSPATFRTGFTTAVIDLNPLGLTLNAEYEVKWTGELNGTATCWYLLELPVTSF